MNSRILILLGGVALTGVLLYPLVSDLMNDGNTNKKEEREYVRQEADLPSNFNIPPFPEPEEAKTEIIEKIVYVGDDNEEPLPEVDDIFKFKKQAVGLSQAERRRREIISKGISSGSIHRVKAIKGTTAEIEVTRAFEDYNKDKDFKAHGLGKSIPTYPVNLERTLTATRFIPAVLYTEIKSELPSRKVIAQIEQDVYGDHGRKILIPKGSKVVGSYDTLGEIGDTRLQIAWNRILTPQGINITIASETADQQGSAGMTGLLDNRFLDRYGSALLFSTISALAQMSVPAGDDNAKAAADAFTSEFGQTTASLIQEGLSLTPRVNIARGTRFNISILTDIWFKEPKDGKGEVVSIKSLQEK